MRILISGGTGLIGKALVKSLTRAGDTVIILTRDKSGKIDSTSIQYIEWDTKSREGLISIIENVDAVINLAGESIGSGFWTRSKKERIIGSRILAGSSLTEAILKASKKPGIFIQASGVGFYGTSLDQTFIEESPNGNDYLSEVARKWEDSSHALDSIGVRRVIIRTGVVLDAGSGALPLMVLPFRFFVGGPLGSGRQFISWIHLEDEIRAIEFALRNPNIIGALNLTSPEPVTNSEFGHVIGRVLHKPFWFPTPAFGLKLILGEKSTLVLDGQRVIPKKLTEFGFKFKFSDLESAIKDILNSK